MKTEDPLKIQQKIVPFEWKSLSEEGAFTGYAAVFNNVDLGGDTIAPGAFTKTIRDKQNHPILWSHRMGEVLGVNKSYKEDDHGLMVEGQLVLSVQRAKEAYDLMKAGAVTGLSIGYETVADEYNYDTDVRTLKEVKLWEYSFTAFPMNPEAQVTGVKVHRFEAQLLGLAEFVEARQGKMSAERITSLQKFQERLSLALQATEAAMQGNAQPESLHSALEGLTSLLQGVN